MNLTRGQDNNIYWELNSKGRFIEIKINKGDTFIVDDYECRYESIFGYDNFDIISAYERLYYLIKKIKEEEVD